MHFIYKLIALSVVFGLVFTGPAAKTTAPEFDELAYESGFDIFEDDSGVAETIADSVLAVPAVGFAIPKVSLVGIIAAAFKIIPKIIGAKVVGVALAVKLIKWLLPKTIFLAIGAIATLGFCKLTDKCSLFTPVVSQLTPQVRSLATTENLNMAQQFLMSALQQYAKEELVN